MDMGGSGGDADVANLPLSDPECIIAQFNCTAFYAAANESQLVTPWAGQFVYGHYVSWYYVAVIGLLMLLHLMHLAIEFHSKNAVGAPRRPSIFRKLQAVGRYFGYRPLDWWPIQWLSLPALGMFSFLVITLVYSVALIFAEQPYYRGHYGYGSPPIAIRSGLMATAVTPALVALGGKWNFITLLTGISHEKLNVVHRWAGWIAFIFAWFHTIPFLLQPNWEGAADSLNHEFYFFDPPDMFTGVPPMAMLFGLCVFSIPQIRAAFYELFYYLHIVFYILYVSLLFWHLDNTGDSWMYLYVTLALWFASFLLRVFMNVRPVRPSSKWLLGAPTTLTNLPGDMTQIDIVAPKGFTFRPAQHLFIRFPKISPFDNHPFTIANAPTPSEERQTLTFLVRTHAGFTKRLNKYSNSHADVEASAWVDGPYGGLTRPVERLYDEIILVAGGGGITACMSWFVHLINEAKAKKTLRVKKITLIWAIREMSHLSWAQRTIEDSLAQSSGLLEVSVRYYITSSSASSSTKEPSSEKAVELEKQPAVDVVSTTSLNSDAAARVGEVIMGRPVIRDLLPSLVSNGRNLIYACGPPSLKHAVGHAAANLQQWVESGDVQEVAMHTETFDW